MGRYGLPRLPAWALGVLSVACLIGLLPASLIYQAWLWSPVVVIVGAVSFIKFLESMSSRCAKTQAAIMKPLVWVGALSAFIFVVHPTVRTVMFKFILEKHTQMLTVDYVWILIYIIISLVAAIVYKWCLSFTPKPTLQGSKITFTKSRGKKG